MDSMTGGFFVQVLVVIAVVAAVYGFIQFVKSRRKRNRADDDADRSLFDQKFYPPPSVLCDFRGSAFVAGAFVVNSLTCMNINRPRRCRGCM